MRAVDRYAYAPLACLITMRASEMGTADEY